MWRFLIIKANKYFVHMDQSKTQTASMINEMILNVAYISIILIKIVNITLSISKLNAIFSLNEI